MSYCRWSTDDFQCDLYCYESVDDNFTTHVAGRKRIFREPLPPLVDSEKDLKGWCERQVKVMQMCDNCDFVDIELPHVGESFYDPDLQSFLDRLLMLKGLGYRFPDSIIEEVREELKAVDREPTERDDASSPRG